MRILVRGDHPIGKRPDKVFTDPELAKEYFSELFKAGYENIEMKLIKEEDHDGIIAGRI